jgi:diguanylate cyclase (GGDEF)-like protein
MLAERAPPPFIRPETAAASEVDPRRLLVVVSEDPVWARWQSWLWAIEQPPIQVERVRTAASAMERLQASAFDLCISAARLDDGCGTQFCRAALGRGNTAPVILIAREPAQEAELEAIGEGVADFLDEAHLDQVILERTIRYTLARRLQAEQLSRLAQHDQLTGLANRVLLEDRLGRALAWARRHDRMVALMVLDLNGFKAVNDRLGHAAGDRLLCIRAERLQKRLRETDTVARPGGDEFALVIENLGRPEHAALVARKLLDAVAPPVPLDGGEVRVTASLGISLFPRDALESDELRRLADAAMYRAKAEGGNLFRFASETIERRVQRGALLGSDLKRALAAGEFVLHFQPQIVLATGSLGVAGLLRWQHPELGVIVAERFVPLAEDCGLIGPLSEWLFDAALTQLAAWRAVGLDRLHLAVPLLGRRQLRWSDAADLLERRIEAGAIDAGALELELDEALLIADGESGFAGAQRLRATGVRLALDAFGAGPTSLRGLQSGLIDTIKLDPILLKNVPDDRQKAAIAAAILDLARRLGLRCVASGGDTQEQVAFLRSHGCSAVQAFMRCPPLPAPPCTRWLRQAVARRDALPAPTAAASFAAAGD